MKVVHWLLLVIVAWWLRQGGAPTVAGDCPNACRGVSVPYPFGLKPECASSKEFLLNCSITEGDGERLLLGNIPIRMISFEDSTMLVSVPEIHDCYDKYGVSENKSGNLVIDLSSYPQYILSDSRNNLTVIGCDTYALLSDKDGMFRSGCIAYCSDHVDFAKETTCSGLGCCQASIPKGLKKLRISINSIDNHVSVWKFSPCGLASVGDRKSFHISSRTLPSFNDTGKRVDLVLDWMVGWDVTCQQAQAKSNRSSYACGNNTDCSDYANGPGYRCFCKDGFKGNPYSRPHGCEDIEESEDPQKDPCHGKCQNQTGNCTCDDPRRGIALAAILGVTLCVTVSASVSVTLKWRIKRINFKRNGGEFLKHHRVPIFTEAELAKATSNFDESNKLGEGGFGSVYSGRIGGAGDAEVTVKKPKDVAGSGDAEVALKKPKDDIAGAADAEVAVKKPKDVAGATGAQIVVKKPKDAHKSLVKRVFHDKLRTVAEINHENVVKLRGICLETRIPLLVYEFISNGTLFEHLHVKKSAILRSWENRLRIATEAAHALKSMHSCEIIHGNIKSANILLDQNYSVKVSDFGTSVLIPPEHIVATKTKGALDYIDPEYLSTGKLTLKSDVYNFGAVLMELLTGEKPTSTITKSGEQVDIIPGFISSMKDNTLFDVISFEPANEDEKMTVGRVAKIAVQCLEQSSRKRPTMIKVARQLVTINQSSTDEEDNEETEPDVGLEKQVSLSIAEEAGEQGTSSCLSCLGIDSVCSCI